VNKGKFAKDRVVPMGRKACEYLREYLDKVRLEWMKAAVAAGHEKAVDERALWLSFYQPHRPIKSQIIEVMVKRYARAIGIKKQVTPHVWRHTCATHMVADGANMIYVQRLLGHHSLRTTQIYARTAIPDVKKTHQKTHPSSGPRLKAAKKATVLPDANRDEEKRFALYRRPKRKQK
jgi:integrase/recombinase XerD